MIFSQRESLIILLLAEYVDNPRFSKRVILIAGHVAFARYAHSSTGLEIGANAKS
jgi:hypothetical protein